LISESLNSQKPRKKSEGSEHKDRSNWTVFRRTQIQTIPNAISITERDGGREKGLLVEVVDDDQGKALQHRNDSTRR